MATAEERNFVEAWSTIARSLPQGEVASAEGIVFAVTGSANPAFNTAFVVDAAASPEALADVRSFFTDRRLGFILRFPAEAADWAQACEALGMADVGDTPLMSTAMPADAPDTEVEGLEVRRVEDAAQFAEHLTVMAVAFGAPEGLLDDVFTPRLLAVEDFAAFTGFVDGVAVGTSALVVTDDTGGVYNVATLPEWRQRGIGAALSAAAMEEARRRGCTLATLQSSSMGMSVYERMGFRTVARYRQFVAV